MVHSLYILHVLYTYNCLYRCTATNRVPYLSHRCTLHTHTHTSTPSPIQPHTTTPYIPTHQQDTPHRTHLTKRTHFSTHRWYEVEHGYCEQEGQEVGVEEEGETVDQGNTGPAHQDLRWEERGHTHVYAPTHAHTDTHTPQTTLGTHFTYAQSSHTMTAEVCKNHMHTHLCSVITYTYTHKQRNRERIQQHFTSPERHTMYIHRMTTMYVHIYSRFRVFSPNCTLQC